MLYGGAATLCVVLCLYLLLSRGKVIAPEIKSDDNSIKLEKR